MEKYEKLKPKKVEFVYKTKFEEFSRMNKIADRIWNWFWILVCVVVLYFVYRIVY